jgi:hypothetical protein
MKRTHYINLVEIGNIFVSLIETRMKNSGCEVMRRTKDEGARNIIKHDLRKNGSIYL